MNNLYQIVKNTFEIEAESILGLIDNLDEQFEKVVLAISKCEGKLVVCGLGKSGLIGRKIAATLASTGTSSFFLHPTEAFHGDLGMISSNDIILGISNSGETDEILRLIPFFKANGNLIIGMSGKPNSTLALNSDFHLNIAVKREACPFNLAPTSSAIAQLAMGDAISIALMEIKNFKEEHFAKLHPGGSLGKKLLSTVKDCMKTDNIPFASTKSDMVEIVTQLTRGRLGICILKDEDISGIITDGDLRRAMVQYNKDFFSLKPIQIATTNPIFISSDTKLLEAQELMLSKKISCILVGDKIKLEGVIQIYDIDL